MMDSFLLIGQSNAAGRGFINEVPPIVNDRIHILRESAWQPMTVPVNPDCDLAGISFSESFADCYVRERNVDVGIIPCAEGGTCIDQWLPGTFLFERACNLAAIAQKTSRITAVLWHQGECDCTAEKHPVYEEKLSLVLNAFCQRLGLADVPILVGGLGDYLKNNSDENLVNNYSHINNALHHLADNRPMTAFVSAEGLDANPDNLHFSAIAQRVLGERYYARYKKVR